MSPDSGGLWIIHLPNPQTIIEVVHEGEQTHSNNAAFSRVYQHEDERIELRLHHYFTTEFGDEESRAIKMLDKAWHWYKSYLEWEDGNIDLNEMANEN